MCLLLFSVRLVIAVDFVNFGQNGDKDFKERCLDVLLDLAVIYKVMPYHFSEFIIYYRYGHWSKQMETTE